MAGMVYLVGAGPGDAGLITVKGLECVKKAQVIVYDRLVNSDILRYASLGAELVFAGKSRQGHTLKQNEINRLLIKKAAQGKRVVRLKGGDPFLFGRGAEETLALSKAGVHFEIVPGVSSALAVPACAGIPLTYRKLSSSLTVITGNEDPEKELPAIDWKHLYQRKGTLVILMGVENIGKIMKKLAKAGAKRSLPVAVISNGSLPDQKIVSGNIQNISGKVYEAGIKPPAVIVAGEVVNLKDISCLTAFSLPLKGKRVLVTRPESQSADLIRLLTEKGASVIKAPLIKTAPLKDDAAFKTVMNNLGSYGYIIFSSVNGVDYLMDRLCKYGVDRNRLRSMNFAAIGRKTAARLENYGLHARIVPEDFSQEGLAEEFLNKEVNSNARILIVRARESRQALQETLESNGFQVENCCVYETKLVMAQKNNLRKLLFGRGLDAVTLTSPSCVKAFKAIFSEKQLERCLKDVEIAVIGPVTAACALSNGIRVDVEAKEYTVEGLTQALEDYYRNKNG
ncbi:MAG: uroporphyrinogen-III C-methyltransferase [Candidatus Omnitrophica bacterium]|nr:uroporphyrinogen-III C-methyltransferase [Candidatus Omnitrophota bacterium]